MPLFLLPRLLETLPRSLPGWVGEELNRKKAIPAGIKCAEVIFMQQATSASPAEAQKAVTPKKVRTESTVCEVLSASFFTSIYTPQCSLLLHGCHWYWIHRCWLGRNS